MPNPESGPDARPQPTLGLIDVVSMIVGIVIGAGIFRAPSIVAGNPVAVQSPEIAPSVARAASAAVHSGIIA